MANESIINKFVNNLPIELHLVDPLVGKYAACGPGTKHYERLQRYIDSGDSQHIYKNTLDKACFYHDAAYAKYKDVPHRHIADKQLMEEAMKVARDETLDGYQRAFAAMIYKFFEKKIQMGQGMEQLAEELHKPVRHNFQRCRVLVYGKDDVWGADLIDMREWKSHNKGYIYLLTVIDVLSKYAWAIPLKDKKADTVKSALEQIIQESERQPHHLWVDEGTEFYNKTMKLYLDKHDINIYSTYSSNKSVVVERFNRTLKTNMWKRFTAENTRNWMDMLPKLMKTYNHRKHSSIRMTPHEASKKENEATVLNRLCPIINRNIEENNKFNVGDTVRISRVKGVFEKGYLPNWSEQIYKIVRVKPTHPVTYILANLHDEVIKGSFYEQELQKTSQEVFRIEKVLKKKTLKGKPYGFVKWIGYSHDFNEWLPMSVIEAV